LNLQWINTCYLPFSKILIPKKMKLISQELINCEHDGKPSNKNEEWKNRWEE
jgi:hypothetical protein